MLLHAFGSALFDAERAGRAPHRFVLALLLCALGALFPTSNAAAETVVVDSTTDAPDADSRDGRCLTANGRCTLRAAIEHIDSQRNAPATPHRVELPAGTFYLRHGTLTLLARGGFTLAGQGMHRTTIDAEERSAILHFHGADDGGTTPDLELTISGMTLRNGHSECGALCLQHADVLLDRVALRDNGSASHGGAVNGLFVDLELRHSLALGNIAVVSGGAISTRSVVVRGSELVGNRALVGEGGAIVTSANLSFFTSVRAEDSEFRENEALLGGGAVSTQALHASRTRWIANRGRRGGAASWVSGRVSGSTFSGNVADHGGALEVWAGPQGDIASWRVPTTAVIETSTFSGNHALDGAALSLAVNPAVTTLLESVTITGNVAEQGGAVHARERAPGRMLRSVIAQNTGGDCTGLLLDTPGSPGTTFDGDGSCGAAFSGDARLGPLADNGGSTLTHAPLAGSPLIDRAGASCPVRDQRLQPRPADGDGDGFASCDVGAVEVLVSGGAAGGGPVCDSDTLHLANPWLTVVCHDWLEGGPFHEDANVFFDCWADGPGCWGDPDWLAEAAERFEEIGLHLHHGLDAWIYAAEGIEHGWPMEGDWLRYGD